MKALHGVIRVIDFINEKTIRAVQWFVLILVLILMYEVVMRYLLGTPTLWSFDATYMVSSFFLALGMAYTLQVGGHVNIDVISERLSVRNRAILFAVLFLVLFFPLWGLLLNNFVPHLLRSWRIGERAAMGSVQPIIYPFKTWIFVSCVLLFLQGISEFLKNLYTVITGDEYYAAKTIRQKAQAEAEQRAAEQRAQEEAAYE